jgi:hypothetical protein
MLRDPPVWSRRRVHNAVGILVSISIAICLDGGFATAEIAGRSPRVLILYPYDERLPATSIAAENARKRLLEATAGKIDLLSEFLDLSRFPEDAYIERMARYLAEKSATAWSAGTRPPSSPSATPSPALPWTLSRESRS